MRAIGVALGLGVLAAAGAAVAVATKARDLPAAEPVALAPELAHFSPLDLAAPDVVYDASTEDKPVTLTRTFERWEALDGRPHLRVELYAKRRLMATSWLRPGSSEGHAQLLCSRRRVGPGDFRLVPPQPILQAPLVAGASWSWRGRVGEDPCRAEFKILAREVRDGVEILEVEQVTTLEGAGEAFVSRRTQTFAAGRGLIGERGTTIAHKQTRRDVVSVEATLHEETEGEAPKK